MQKEIANSGILFYCKFPVPFHGIKKNSKQIAVNRKTGARFIRSNDRAKFAQDWLVKKLTTERLKQGIDTITCDTNIKFIFHIPESLYYTKQGIRSKKVADLSNLYETPQDALQKALIIENDSQVESHDGSRRVPIKDNTAWLEIEIADVSKLKQ